MGDRFAPYCSFSSSMKASKQLMRDMMECDITARHCGFLYAEPKKIVQTDEDDEHKRKKMDVDEQDKGMTVDRYEYFCHCRLNQNGQCSAHKNWRKETYKELINSLKTESEQLFVFNCLLRQTNNMIMSDKHCRQNECSLDGLLSHDDMELLDNSMI